MSLDSMKEIFDRMEAEHKPFWEIVLETDMDERQVTRQQSMAKMLTTWQYMVDAADTYTGRRRSVSGLVGGDGLKMRQYSIRGRAMSGGYVSEVIAEALSMAESNACMRRIVAAPTAGARRAAAPRARGRGRAGRPPRLNPIRRSPHTLHSRGRRRTCAGRRSPPCRREGFFLLLRSESCCLLLRIGLADVNGDLVSADRAHVVAAHLDAGGNGVAAAVGGDVG